MAVAQVLGGRYEVMDLIGNGGMAVVCRARDNVLGRTVAVKLLAGRYAGDPESRQRIRDEARAAAKLSHPNIAQVYDYGESDADGTCLPYVVMELVRGGTLQDRLDAGPVSPRFAMRVGAEVAAALAAAHTDGLVHRDIKPANVMVPPSGVKVVDFGIAAAVGTGGSTDPDAEVLGTPAYVAPERLLDDVTEPASDIYALGVLLYQMLSGHSPWSADSTTQMLAAHIYIDPTPLPQLPEVPEYVTALCNRCLAKDPTQRPSARETAALLAQGAGMRVVEDLPPPAAVAAGPAVDRQPSVLLPRPRSADGPAAAAALAGGAALTNAGQTDAAQASAAQTSAAQTSAAQTSAAQASAAQASAAQASAAQADAIQADAARTDAARTDAAMAGGDAVADPVLRPAAAVPGDPAPAAESPAGPPPPEPGPATPDAEAPRRRRAALLVGLSVLAAAGLLLWFLLPGDREPERSVAEPPVVSAPAGAVPEVVPSGARPDGSPGGPDAPGRGLAPGPDTGQPSGGTQRGGAAGEGTPTVAPDATDPADPDPEPTGRADPDPTTTSPDEDEGEEEEPPAAQERTLTSTGGSVRATCTSSGSARLLSWSASKPYKVQEVDEGPADVARAVFRHGNRYVRMAVTCNDGVPSADTTQD
ncbi:serine/threonine-protein kinase [Jidongwangia harbinensis]|uniref:serine/threonine-protein kinase n=1 Tax=Jidongwangia harbinensis TaxID=2878561 RepID=UPI001CDA1168|nr:serine/threonine-protein kinase [Jidongwangia harbinensis]MCA2213170.1 protein kinase [Jidongwangia harbinensis]